MRHARRTAPPARAFACALVALATLRAAEPVSTWTPVFGGVATAGIAVDRVDGSVYAVVERQGISKSVDHGKTFTLVDGAIVKSHAETGCGLTMDPEGGRLMCFMCYGDAGGTLDGGRTWFKSSQGHWNWGCVDWQDPQARTMLAYSHGGSGIQLSCDQGASWTRVSGVGGLHLGVAGPDALLVGGDGGIFLSATRGTSWQKVSDLQPIGRTMKVSKGRCYWLTAAGVIASADAGRTWARLGAAVDGCVGPYFGADEHSLLVVGLSGFSVSHDDGASWRVVATLPDSIRAGWDAPEGGSQRPYWFVQFGWDPKANILYASSLHAPLLTCQLPLDQEVAAEIDRLVAQVERCKDPASTAYRHAAIRLYLAHERVPVDAERSAKVDALTASVKDEIDSRRASVRAALAAWEPRTFDLLLAEQRRPFAGTALDPWFDEAALVGKASAAVARFRRSGKGPIAPATRDAVVASLDASAKKLDDAGFRQHLGGLRAAVVGLAAYDR